MPLIRALFEMCLHRVGKERIACGEVCVNAIQCEKVNGTNVSIAMKKAYVRIATSERECFESKAKPKYPHTVAVQSDHNR